MVGKVREDLILKDLSEFYMRYLRKISKCHTNLRPNINLYGSDKKLINKKKARNENF